MLGVPHRSKGRCILSLFFFFFNLELKTQLLPFMFLKKKKRLKATGTLSTTTAVLWAVPSSHVLMGRVRPRWRFEPTRDPGNVLPLEAPTPGACNERPCAATTGLCDASLAQSLGTSPRTALVVF